MPPQYQIGMQIPQARPRISAGVQPAARSNDDWSGSTGPPFDAQPQRQQAPPPGVQWNARLEQPHMIGGNSPGNSESIAYYTAMANPNGRYDKINESNEAERAAWDHNKNSVGPARTTYHADGHISNPPAQDPGFNVYNHASEMPSGEQAEMHAFRNGVAPQQSQMMPDPAKQTPRIGVPSQSQNPAGIGFQSVPPGQTPSFNGHTEMRNAMLSGLSRDMQAASAAGDTAKLNDLFAQRGALDNGGFMGHSRYMQDKALHEAQIGKLGGAGGGIPKDKEGNYDINVARLKGMQEMNSADGGDEVANQYAVQNYLNAARRGKPYTIDPAHVPAVAATLLPHMKDLLATDANGPVHSVQDILAAAQTRDPRLFQSPGGVAAQGLLASIRQTHGGTLEKDLKMPANPNAYAPAADSNIGMMVGPLGRIGIGATGAALDNLWNWRGSVINPGQSYADQSKANTLYNALANPTQK